MSSGKPQVYLILGAAGSGRREVVADLLEGGASEGDRPIVLLEESEAPSPADASFPDAARWSWRDGQLAAEVPGGFSPVYFISAGRGNPVEQIEQFQNWLPGSGAELTRIICIVNCQLAEKHPPLLAWYEACIHFSDVVLLNQREGVANKWVSEFLRHFEKLYYPCLFEFVKHGRVENPARVLAPEARRVTHIFEEEQDWIFTNSQGETIDEEEESEDSDEEVEAKPAEDIYFARDAAGRRAKRIPDIEKYLPPRSDESTRAASSPGQSRERL